ncbi:hypothetical protein NMY22_g19981 [Coprinellus aureogranulatus]|nr:hypothetical protein NMY22_g19981 [Coprinellus aureogranulatus]
MLRTKEGIQTLADAVSQHGDALTAFISADVTADTHPQRVQEMLALLQDTQHAVEEWAENETQSTQSHQSIPRSKWFFLMKLEEGQSVVAWWGAHARRLPTWASLARDYLAIMALSVSSERAFSAAGITISKRRNALKADIVEAL